MPRGDSWSHIPTYVKYNIESTETGHIIKIITEENVHTFVCDWPTYRRNFGLSHQPTKMENNHDNKKR
jgi:hypothetical protein